MRVHACIVGCKLHRRTAFRPRPRNRPREQLPAQALTAAALVNPHRFHLRPPAALMRETGDKGKLQGGDNLPLLRVVVIMLFLLSLLYHDRRQEKKTPRAVSV